MIFQWFDILEISQLSEVSSGVGVVVLGSNISAARVSEIQRMVAAREMPGNWESLSIKYIAGIKINLDMEYVIRVDAIPLLYEFIIASSSLSARKGVDIYKGESWFLSSEQVSGNLLRLKFDFISGNVDNLGYHEISLDDLAVFLATRISRMVDLLEENGADLLSILKQFPIALFYRT